MGLINDLKLFREERHELIQLRQYLDYLSDRYDKVTQGLRTQSEEYQHAINEYGADSGLTFAEIARIETKQALRRAEHWRVPVAQRPWKEGQDSGIWEWNSVHARYYLTDEGLRQIRRDVYEEREMWLKPFLSWMAIIISVVSLTVSVLKH